MVLSLGLTPIGLSQDEVGKKKGKSRLRQKLTGGGGASRAH